MLSFYDPPFLEISEKSLEIFDYTDYDTITPIRNGLKI